MTRATSIRTGLVLVAGTLALVGATWFALGRHPTSSEIEVCRFVLTSQLEHELATWRARTEGTTPPSDDEPRSNRYAACAPVYSAPKCREALARSMESEPASRLSRLSTACRDAYCPVLAPQPRLCTTEPHSPTELHTMWQELDRAILAHDLGPRARPLLDVYDRADREGPAAVAAYFDAGAPAWQGSHGTQIRMVPNSELDRDE